MPDVMTTLLKRSKTGFIANDGSRQLFRVVTSNVSARHRNACNSREVKYRIWDGGVFCFKWLEDEEEPWDGMMVIRSNLQACQLLRYLFRKWKLG